MLIRIIATGETGEHSQLFPNVSFPFDTPQQDWMTENGVEIVVAPIYVPTQQEIDEQARRNAKYNRQIAVDSITVTVNGKVFDGDEVAQTRMTRAIVGMQITGQPTIDWILNNNVVTQATLAELKEALCLAGARQAELWII
jgi:hypothetical protein